MIDVDMKILIARRGKRIRMWHKKGTTEIYVSLERPIIDVDTVVTRYGGKHSQTFSDAYPIMNLLKSVLIDGTEKALIQEVLAHPYEYFD